MIFIKKALEKQKAEISLVALLDKVLRGFERARSHKEVHMSMLSQEGGFCAREFALLDLTNKTLRGDFVTGPMRVAYDTGNALSDLVRNKWLAEHVVGDWKCQACGTVMQFSKVPLAKCPNCKLKLWAYREPRFIDVPSQAQGNIDFFIDFNHGRHYLVEVKTIDKDEFSELAGPYAEHRIRTQLYLRAIERSNSPHAKKIDTSFGIVLYISKGYGKKDKASGKITPFKEFHVQADRDAADAILARGEALAKFRAGGPIPEGICPNSFVPRAKRCCALRECFSGKYPAGK